MNAPCELRLNFQIEPPSTRRRRWRSLWRATNADLVQRHRWYRVLLHLAAAVWSGRNLRWHRDGILRELRGKKPGGNGRNPRNRHD